MNMNKPSVERINYYLRKVVQYGGINPSKRRNPYRYDRLMLYKKLMHEQIDRETVAQMRLREGQLISDLITERDELKKELEAYKEKERMLIALLMKERGVKRCHDR